MHTAALIILALPLASQFDDAPRAIPAEVIAPVQCGANSLADSLHVGDIADISIAVMGARWWIPSVAEDGAARFAEGANLSLVDQETSQSQAVTEVWQTAAAVSIPVPADASPGQTFDLTADNGFVHVLRVAVGEPVVSDGALTDVQVVAGDAQRCQVLCAMDGLTLPAAPLLRFTHTGGALVLDAFAWIEGDAPPMETALHRADSYLLEAVTEPTVIEIALDEWGWDAALDVTVRARDPGDLTLLHDELIAVAPLGSVPADTTGLEDCRGGGETQPFGCPLFGGSNIALLFAPLLALRLRRLRRRSSRS